MFQAANHRLERETSGTRVLVGKRLCHDASMPRWVRSYWGEEDVTFLWEVDDDGWVRRHVELVGKDFRPQAAAALDEWMRELEAGRIQRYQSRYGVLADQPITDWDFPHTTITQAEFEEIWAAARSALESTR